MPNVDGETHPDRIPVLIRHELLLVVAILVLYQLGRFVAFGDAFEHAAEIWRFEQQIGIAVEPALQAWVLEHPAVVTFLAWYYMPMHLVPFLGFFLWHLLRRTAEYPYFRAAAVATLVPGLFLYSLYPLAPPRLLPEVGVVDLVGHAGAITLTTEGIVDVANQTAAFPSEHVIWAVVLGWAFVRLWDRRWLPVAVLHVAITCFGVIAMGHHFLVDVVAGLLFAGLAVGLVDVALLEPHLRTQQAARRRRAAVDHAASGQETAELRREARTD